MHISWGWIKQRPQFIAEELAKTCEVDVYYRMSNHNKKGENPSFSDGNLQVKGFRNLPLERLTFIPLSFSYKINKLIWKTMRIDINSYDYIWVTDPVLWWLFKDAINTDKTKLIYDCMDDYSAFPYMDNYPKYKFFNEKYEKLILQKADFVFCSANALKMKLYERYGINRKYFIVNNAITKDIETYEQQNKDLNLPKNSLVYIGTVSEWFDFGYTLKALDEFPDLHVVLYGPKRLDIIPEHERLEFRGTIPHSQLLAVMNKAKALFMPFVVNELIESVNPVKLYEYIYSGKPILASKYGETDFFSDYITLYSNYTEFRNFIQNFIFSDSHLDKERMQRFALNNTWEARTKSLLKIIEI